MRFVALLFDRVTQLDLTGPVQLFSQLPDAEIHLAARELRPVDTDAGFSINPTTTLDTAPQADVLLIPGGDGAFDALEDLATINFVRQQAAGARYVTSVCTGAFVLGAAELLVGRRATTHWAAHDLLPLVGAVPERARVVRDGNIITGGGVTSGIDFALTLIAETHDPATARRLQLVMEYDPAPPFDAGSPTSADTDPADATRIAATTRRKRLPVLQALGLPSSTAL
jgi:cyclohexyl-isocyanide hydratase